MATRYSWNETHDAPHSSFRVGGRRGTAADPRHARSSKAYILVEIRNFGPEEVPSPYASGAITLARYDPSGPDIRGAARSPNTTVPPGEPLRVTIGFSPFRTAVSKPLVKGKRRELFFVAVPPDRWVVEGAQNTAFSLGSRMFVLEAGKVSDLGVFMPDGDWAAGESQAKAMRKAITSALFLGIGGSGQPRPAMVRWHPRGPGDMPVPPAVAALPAASVSFEPAVGFGNYLGGLVNRFGGRAERPVAIAPVPVP